MSTPLQVINFTSPVVGQTGSIDLTAVAPTSNPAFIGKMATIVFYNESGVGLRLTGRDTGFAMDLPAGAWIPAPIPASEGLINYSILYIISNALISSLIATYFAPGEPVRGASLGNSPVGGSLTSPSTPLVLLTDTTGQNADAIDFTDKRVGAHEIQMMKNHPTMGAGEGLSVVDITAGNIFPLVLSVVANQMDNGTMLTDGAGTWKAVAFKTIAGTQATVKAGGIGQASAGAQSFAFPSEYRTVNTPSSITLAASNSANNGGASAVNIDTFGFFTTFASSGAGGVDWRGTGTTVGN